MGSIVEGVIAQEYFTFCSKYLKGAEIRLNYVGRNYASESINNKLFLSNFSQNGSPFGQYK